MKKIKKYFLKNVGSWAPNPRGCFTKNLHFGKYPAPYSPRIGCFGAVVFAPQFEKHFIKDELWEQRFVWGKNNREV